jgi:hypothetical protein
MGGIPRSRNPPPRYHQAADYASGSNLPNGLAPLRSQWRRVGKPRSVVARSPCDEATQAFLPDKATLDSAEAECVRIRVLMFRMDFRSSPSGLFLAASSLSTRWAAAEVARLAR